MTALTSLFFPRSVAIVGASDNPKRIGGRLLANLIKGGYEGSIYPVNPNRPVVQGRDAFPSIEALPEVVDMVAIAVGGSEGLAHLRACCQIGVPGVVVFSSEIGATSQELPELLAGGLPSLTVTRIVGPNSNGVINPEIGLYASFTSMLDRGLPTPGSVAVATQSAGVGASYTLEYLRRRALGIRFWCHVGEEADVSLDEVLNFYAMDPDIRSVAVNFEMPHRPREFTEALASLEKAGKHVAGFHAGSSAVGQAAAATHTGVLTSVRPRVLLGVAAQRGMQHGKSLRQICNTLEAFSYLDRDVMNLRLAVLTTSGGVGVSLADALAEVDEVSLPGLEAHVRDKLLAIAPFASIGNPIDLTAQIINEPELLAKVLRLLDGDDAFDGLVVYLPSGDLGDVVAVAVEQRTADAAGVIIAVGLASEKARQTLHRAGVPLFDEPDDLREALSCWFAGNATLVRQHAPEALASIASRERVREALIGLRTRAVRALNDVSGDILLLDETASKTCLDSVGTRVPRSMRIFTKDDMFRATESLGYPLVLKLLSPGVAHKAARGHVRLPIRDLAAALEATDELFAARDAETAGGVLLAEEMILGVAEIFLSVQRDDEFGPLAVIARGGVDVERRDSMATVCALPLSRVDVALMLESTRLPLPTGSGGRKLLDELTVVIATLGELLEVGEPEGLESIEANPVVVGREGSPVLVDALFSFRAAHCGGAAKSAQFEKNK